MEIHTPEPLDLKAVEERMNLTLGEEQALAPDVQALLAALRATRAALEPFVSMRWDWGEQTASAIAILADEGPMQNVTVEDWRHARAVLASVSDAEERDP